MSQIKNEDKSYDAVIIGFGKGGKTLAGKLAAKGQRVALIEKSKEMYGGTCINVGCIPSKSLVHSAELSDTIGGSFEERAARYAEAVDERGRVVTLLRGKNYGKLAGLKNVDIYDGFGSFVSPREVKVTADDGETLLTGEKIFINTGSVSVKPHILGLDSCPYVLYSDGLLSLRELPRRLVIIGGGYIGVEFASMYSRFGSKVTIIQDGPVFLPREDEDVAAEIRKILESRGVEIITGAQIHLITTEDGFASVHYNKDDQDFSVDGEAVLAATGRRPNTDGLNAEAAGVELTPRGAVKTDELLRTTAPNIWAMGDVAGGLQFTYISLDDFRIVAAQLEGRQGHTAAARGNVPYSVFMAPTFSRVGMNEREAQAAGKKIVVKKLPAAAIPKAQVLRETNGLLKAVIDAETNKILGAMLICADSHEMINTVKIAMDCGADYTVLRDAIYTHPTMSEALNDLFA